MQIKLNIILYGAVLLLGISCTSQNQAESDTAMSPLQLINEQIKKNPYDASLRLQRAQYFFDREAYKNAITELEEAIKLDSLNPELYILLSDAYLYDFQSKEAVESLEKIIGLLPGNVPSLLKLTRLHYTLQQYDLAILTVNEVFKVDMQNAEASFLLGAILRAQGNQEAAMNALQLAVELDPEIIDAWILLGDMYDLKGDPKALLYFNNALDIDSENIQALHSKAFYLQNHGEIEAAIDLYQNIHSIDSLYGDAYLNAGILYLEIDSVSRAFEEFDQLTLYQPDSYLAYYYRGISNELLGNSEAALTDYERAVRINPAFEKANEALEAFSK